MHRRRRKASLRWLRRAALFVATLYVIWFRRIDDVIWIIQQTV